MLSSKNEQHQTSLYDPWSKTLPNLDIICSVLVYAAEMDIIRYETIQEVAGPSTGEILLEMWEWKLLLSVRSSKCGEWDSRIMVIQSGEVFEMPNISRALTSNAIESGNLSTLINQIYQRYLEDFSFPSKSLEQCQ